MASYSLQASEPTVQVLGPTTVNDVYYCTILTSPSNVLASIPVGASAFLLNKAAEELTAFADGIETIIGRGNVIAAQGAQTIDPNGLLADQVSFIVEYVPPNTSNTNITGEALVPVGLLSQSDPAIAQVTLAEAEQKITDVYNSLKSAAGA